MKLRTLAPALVISLLPLAAFAQDRPYWPPELPDQSCFGCGQISLCLFETGSPSLWAHGPYTWGTAFGLSLDAMEERITENSNGNLTIHYSSSDVDIAYRTPGGAIWWSDPPFSGHAVVQGVLNTEHNPPGVLGVSCPFTAVTKGIVVSPAGERFRLTATSISQPLSPLMRCDCGPVKEDIDLVPVN